MKVTLWNKKTRTRLWNGLLYFTFYIHKHTQYKFGQNKNAQKTAQTKSRSFGDRVTKHKWGVVWNYKGELQEHTCWISNLLVHETNMSVSTDNIIRQSCEQTT